MSKANKRAIAPTREENYPEWYQQVIKAADLAEGSCVRGCMVIKPWGYGIWESIQQKLDRRIKQMGHENAYFPLFIPLSLLQREASHVEGFAKECAVVTHHRLEMQNGTLVPASPLEEPLVVRPTSETVIGDAYSRWIESWRDLPLLINQWANVVRWEMRPRLFLRTAEFLWQEGHTVHASEAEAIEETESILRMYQEFLEKELAIPVICGEKSPAERFPGAVRTYSLEAMMQDGKALQAGTSHYLGQNFSKAANIRFCNRQGELEYGYTTSWGMTTRLIGALIMTHSDDDGLRLPPNIAPKQVVIIPVTPDEETKDEVIAYAKSLKQAIETEAAWRQPIVVHLDLRDKRGGEKNWEWIKKGVPVRLEVGPRDLEHKQVMVARRDREVKEKQAMAKELLLKELPSILDDMQARYLRQAEEFRNQKICKDLRSFEEMKLYFGSEEAAEEKGGNSGFVLGKWSGDENSEKLLDELKVTIRCLPLNQSGTSGKCLLTGAPATLDALFAKAY